MYNRENGDGSLEFVDKLTGEKSLIGVANSETEGKDSHALLKEPKKSRTATEGRPPSKEFSKLKSKHSQLCA